MAGRQFSFFLGPNDQKSFEEALRGTGQVAFLKDRSHSPVAETQNSSVILKFGEEWLRILIARRDDVDKIRFKPIKDRNDFSCDVTLEPIVQFSRCYVDDKIIRPGRLYRVDEYFDTNDKLKEKSPAFIEWADQLFANGKEALHKIGPGLYAGTEALALREAGVEFEGLEAKAR
jgi:hypothetical protein